MNSALLFYQTAISSCPYWPNQSERNLVADPDWPMTPELYSILLEHGFRRSGDTLYRPYCPHCQACVPVRIDSQAHHLSRTQKRTLRRNAELQSQLTPAQFSEEHLQLYRHYLNTRHSDSSMANPSAEDFQRFLLSHWSEVYFLEARDARGALKAVMVCDKVGDHLSAVYSYYDPEPAARSLGTYLVCQAVHWVQAAWQGRYVYLGYWIDQHPKMAYKRRFNGLEYLLGNEWLTHYGPLSESPPHC